MESLWMFSGAFLSWGNPGCKHQTLLSFLANCRLFLQPSPRVPLFSSTFSSEMFPLRVVFCFFAVCCSDLLHSELWPLHYPLAGQHPAVQLRAWDLHQHSTVRARQLAAPGPSPVSHGELAEVGSFSMLATISCIIPIKLEL